MNIFSKEYCLKWKHKFMDSYIKLFGEIEIIFDCDDLLWDFNGMACKIANIPIEDITTFNYDENNRLTDNQREALKQAYKRSDIFENMDFYPGTEKIECLIAMGCCVRIVSNSCSQETINHKLRQLKTLIPSLNDDGFRMNLIKPNVHIDKGITERTLVFCDDNANNVVDSKAQYNFMPAKNWNISAAEQKKIANKNVMYFQNTDELISGIIYLVKQTVYKALGIESLIISGAAEQSLTAHIADRFFTIEEKENQYSLVITNLKHEIIHDEVISKKNSDIFDTMNGIIESVRSMTQPCAIKGLIGANSRLMYAE